MDEIEKRKFAAEKMTLHRKSMHKNVEKYTIPFSFGCFVKRDIPILLLWNIP
jgi:hypothetical protein